MVDAHAIPVPPVPSSREALAQRYKEHVAGANKEMLEWVTGAIIREFPDGRDPAGDAPLAEAGESRSRRSNLRPPPRTKRGSTGDSPDVSALRVRLEGMLTEDGFVNAAIKVYEDALMKRVAADNSDMIKRRRMAWSAED
jgi:hypothetical protein